ncbi:MAG: FAD-dependent monooxygenase [Xanthobacteraceae bacterium]|nr:FAD-dependent monooxygenase [Xanthobacteraceae bacterium]
MKAGHAEIAGAGFGGLVSAIALAERGWTVRVNERRDSLLGEGYGIAIHNNMARIFAGFGILDRVLAGGVRIDRRDSLDRTGRVVMTRKTARSPYRIDRQHIIALLAERALEAGAEIKFDAQVASADPAGAVALAGGETRKADLVIAADGINSGIREQLGLTDRRIWGRDCGARINIPRRPQEIAADDREGTVMIEAWADKRRVLYCPVTRNEFYVLLTCTRQDEGAAVSPIDPEVWARSFPFMRELFVRMRDEADWPQSHWAHFQTMRLKRWSAGRIAVLGDAAHAMPPYLAQGAGHAMMNALGLAESLREADTIEAALAQWERRERPLTEHTQLCTRIYGATMFLPAPLKKISILVEKLPWVAAQYVRAANHVPTGCDAGVNIDARMGGTISA